MGAAYPVAEYIGFFLVCTVVSELAAVVLCVFLGRKLAVRFQRFWLGYVPLVGFAFYLFFLGGYVLPILEQTGDLLITSEYDVKTTAGEIDSIIPVEHAPLYYINGEIRGADYIVIDEASYYVISDGLLAEGMLVELQYAQFENNVVLSWQEVSADRVAVVDKEQTDVNSIEKTEMPQEEVPQEIQRIARVLVQVGFFGFIALLAVTNLVHQRIVNYLFAKDAAVHGQIIPNRVAAVFTAIPLVFISMVIVGMSMENGEYHGLLILIMGGGLMIGFMLMEQFTYLKIDGQYILINKLGKMKQHSMTDIRCVTWKSCRGIIGKQLVVIFNDGKSYWFNMDHYMGVQNVFNELKKHLDDLSNAVPAEK